MSNEKEAKPNTTKEYLAALVIIAFCLPWISTTGISFMVWMPSAQLTAGNALVACVCWGFVVFYDNTRWLRYIAASLLLAWGGYSWFMLFSHPIRLSYGLRLLLTD